MIKYYKLLDLLNKYSIKKETLRQGIGISSATMSKISSHKLVSLDVIDKICLFLECQPGDIIEVVKDEYETKNGLIVYKTNELVYSGVDTSTPLEQENIRDSENGLIQKGFPQEIEINGVKYTIAPGGVKE